MSFDKDKLKVWLFHIFDESSSMAAGNLDRFSATKSDCFYGVVIEQRLSVPSSRTLLVGQHFQK